MAEPVERVRNPDWTREELILATSLVRRNDWHELRTQYPEVLELSALLRALDIHPAHKRGARFRSPDSVSRKTGDIMTARTGSQGTRTRGGALTQAVVRQFEADGEQMEELALALRQRAQLENLFPAPDDRIPDLDLDVPAEEGETVQRLHLARERDARLRKAKINSVKAAGASLGCEVCSFDFGSTYGERGRDFIEVHHRVPLHASGPTKTSLRDLALLCSNCHRMIHRSQPWLTIDQLASTLRAASKTRQEAGS